MTRTASRLLALLAVALANVADAERFSYDRYTNIVERQMFGPLPDDFDPTKPPSEVVKSSAERKKAEAQAEKAEELKSAVNFSMINVTPDGEVKVGFTDNSDKQTPRNYYLGVGEERDGWLVKEANPSNATMTVVKGEIEVTLTVGGDSSKSDSTVTKKAGAPKAAAMASDGRRDHSTLMGLPSRTLSKKELAARLDALEKTEQAKDKATREAEKERNDAKHAQERAEDALRYEREKNEMLQAVLKSRESRQQEAKPVAESAPEPVSEPVQDPVPEDSEETSHEDDDAE